MGFSSKYNRVFGLLSATGLFLSFFFLVSTGNLSTWILFFCMVFLNIFLSLNARCPNCNFLAGRDFETGAYIPLGKQCTKCGCEYI